MQTLARRSCAVHHTAAAARPAAPCRAAAAPCAPRFTSTSGGHRSISSSEFASSSAPQRRCRCRAAPVEAPASLAPEQQQEWASCVEQLTALGFDAEAADKIVARAFGWGSQAYWRREKVEAAPDAAQAAAALDLLRDLGITDEQLAKIVKAFPELIGCTQEALQGNVAKLRKEWRLDGQVLANFIVRQPAVLGYTIDCMGDCAGECNRCWARA